MKINFIHEKGIKNTNEDSYLIGDNIWGVFDGANSLNKYADADGRTGGLIASTIAKESFEMNDGLLRDMAIKANGKIGEEMKKRGIDTSDKLNLWCTNLAVVKIENNRINWLQLADSATIFIYRDNSFKVIMDEESHDRETLVKWGELAKNKTENIREALKDQIKKVRRDINVSYGFLTGEKEAIGFLREGTEELEKVRHILLSTDGFVLPQKDPNSPHPWDEFISRYLKDGIEGLKNHIRAIEESDPDCWTYPRQKKHDDMTAISIVL
jgi:hypothetical protein